MNHLVLITGAVIAFVFAVAFALLIAAQTVMSFWRLLIQSKDPMLVVLLSIIGVLSMFIATMYVLKGFSA